MKNKIVLAVQILAGIMLVTFGLNKFLQFIPMPAPTPLMGEYMKALFMTGFIFPIIAVIQIIAGLSFILNKFTALMAILIMPVMINAFLAHLFLDPAGMGGSLFLVIAIIIVMVKYRDRYKEIFEV